VPCNVRALVRKSRCAACGVSAATEWSAGEASPLILMGCMGVDRWREDTCSLRQTKLEEQAAILAGARRARIERREAQAGTRPPRSIHSSRSGLRVSFVEILARCATLEPAFAQRRPLIINNSTSKPRRERRVGSSPACTCFVVSLRLGPGAASPLARFEYACVAHEGE